MWLVAGLLATAAMHHLRVRLKKQHGTRRVNYPSALDPEEPMDGPQTGTTGRASEGVPSRLPPPQPEPMSVAPHTSPECEQPVGSRPSAQATIPTEVLLEDAPAAPPAAVVRHSIVAERASAALSAAAAVPVRTHPLWDALKAAAPRRSSTTPHCLSRPPIGA